MFEVRRANSDRSSVQVVEKTVALVATTCTFGDYFVNPATKTIDICYRDSGRGNAVELTVNSVECRMLCNLTPDKEKFTRLWSNTSQWAGGVLPNAASNVEIPASWTLIVDVSSITINSLRVLGRLFFRDMDITFSAKNIEVAGSFIVGNSTHPFRSALNIDIVGADSSQTQTVGGVTLSKSIIVTGRM